MDTEARADQAQFSDHVSEVASIPRSEKSVELGILSKVSKQRFSSPHGAPVRPVLAAGVVLDQALIPLEGIPADITLMVVAEQNIPFGLFDPKTARDVFSVIVDFVLSIDRPYA